MLLPLLLPDFDVDIEEELGTEELPNQPQSTPPPWRTVSFNSSSEEVSIGSGDSALDSATLTNQSDESSSTTPEWEENISNIGQLFGGGNDDDWATEEQSEIIDFPNAETVESVPALAMLSEYEAPVTSVSSDQQSPVAPRVSRTSSAQLNRRDLIAPQLTIDPEGIDLSVVT